MTKRVCIILNSEANEVLRTGKVPDHRFHSHIGIGVARRQQMEGEIVWVGDSESFAVIRYVQVLEQSQLMRIVTGRVANRMVSNEEATWVDKSKTSIALSQRPALGYRPRPSEAYVVMQRIF